MGLHLYFSHRLEDLAAALSRHLAAAAPEARLFEPTAIVHPNLNMKKWLQLAIARHNGVAANLAFQSFDEAVAAWVSAGGAPATTPKALDQERLRWLILRALLEPDRSDAPTAALAPLHRYIGLTPAPSTDWTRSQAAKAWQLAGELARLLRDFELQRPDWPPAWLASTALLADGSADAIPAALATLYRRIFAVGGLRDHWSSTLGERWLTLAGWAVEAGVSPPRAAADCTALHLFGLPQLSRVHVRLLFTMAAQRPVYLYSLNLGALPTGSRPPEAASDWFAAPTTRLAQPDEPWEDIDEPSEPGATSDDLAIRCWNRVGVENLQLLAAARTEHSAVATRVEWLGEPGSPQVASGLLGRLQKRLLDPAAPIPQPSDSPVASMPTAAADGQPETLQMARCPSVAREVEAVYQCILRNLVRDPSLLQNDILVLVPDMAAYRPAIHAAFDRGDGRIGYNLNDLPGADESLYAQAVQATLQLAEGRFTRSEVFAFLQNPCVASRLNLDRPRLLCWGRWAAALNVYSGEGAPGETEAFTWRQALRRMALGRMLEAPSPRLTDDDPPPADFHGWIPYADAETADREALDPFIATLDRLEAGVAVLRRAENDPVAWLQALQRFLEQFAAPPPDAPAEASVAMAVREAIGRLLDWTRQQIEAGWPPPPHALLRQAVLETLNTLQSRQGRYLSGGVTLSTQYPMRPIPFRLVFVLGLDEHHFPVHARHSALDLRRRGRRPGDADEADLQRLMFLEAILSARDRLYLTYVHRDLQKDEERLPCALLTQLQDWLRPLTADGKLPCVTVPLHSHAPSHWLPNGFERHEMEDSATPNDFETNFDALDRRLAEAELQRPAGGSAVAAAAALAPPRKRAPMPVATIEAPVRRLAQFLRSPLLSALRQHLSLSESYAEDEEAALEAETEPFYLTGSAERGGIRAAVAELLAGQPRSAAVAAGLNRLQLQHRLGATPAGDFQRAAAARFASQMQNEYWPASDGGDRPEALAALRNWRYRPGMVFGDGREIRRSMERCGAIALPTSRHRGNLQPLPIRMHGRLSHCFSAPDHRQLQVVTPITQTRANAGKMPVDLFEPVLLAAGLLAARLPGGAVEGLANTDPLAQFDSVRFHAFLLDADLLFDWQMTPEQAATALGALIADWASPGDFQDLPFKLLAAHWDDLQALHRGDPAAPTAADLQAALERELELTEGDDSFGGFQPTPLQRLAGMRLPEDCVAVALRRYDLLLRLMSVKHQDVSASEPVSPPAVTSKPTRRKGGARGTSPK